MTGIFSYEAEDFGSRSCLDFSIQLKRKAGVFPPCTTRMLESRDINLPCPEKLRSSAMAHSRKQKAFTVGSSWAEIHDGIPGQPIEGLLNSYNQ